jgi:hypothetical protein
MNTFRHAVATVLALPVLCSTGPVALQGAAPEISAPPRAVEGAVEGAVIASRCPAVVAAAVDRLIDSRLSAAHIPASPAADDAEFIRRASLDILGRIPRAERVAVFLADSDPDKRTKYIDELLSDREYGEHFATIWYHRIVKPDDDNRYGLIGNHFQDWLADAFNQNHGWDRIVADIVTATGDRDRQPAATFWLANVGDAKAGQPEPNKVTAAATRLFLGVRLECCECHDHPFGTLKQTDFWQTAAFFTRVRAEDSSKKVAKQGSTPSVNESGHAKGKRRADRQESAPFGAIAIPYVKDKTVTASFLDGTKPDLAGRTTLRPLFARWLTAPENPYFARAAVNKMWANFFGRGLVDPVDDLRPENLAKCTHPEVMAALSEEFVASGFDLKDLVRCICNSKAYQRTSDPLPGNSGDDTLYARMPLKVLSADMLFDSLAVALNHPAADDSARDKDARKKRKREGGVREKFRKFFHAEADDDVGVVEDYNYGIPQVLRLMNSRQVCDTSKTVAKLAKPNVPPEKVVEGLYLTALSRKPTPAELSHLRKFLAKETDRTKGYTDVLWALLNGSEFLFNH